MDGQTMAFAVDGPAQHIPIVPDLSQEDGTHWIAYKQGVRFKS